MLFSSIIFFSEAPFIDEPPLHALLYYLARQVQMFCDDWDMQDILEVGLFVLISEWDIFNKYAELGELSHAQF